MSNSTCSSGDLPSPTHLFHTIRRTCQDTEWPSTLTIDYIPDEVLLEIFDSYREDIDPYALRSAVVEAACVDLSHTCVQNVACCHICVVLSFGFEYS